MTALITGTVFGEHDTGGHPESAFRNQTLLEMVNREFSHLEFLDFKAATPQSVMRVHSLEQFQAIAAVASAGGGEVGPEAIVSKGSLRAATAAVGAAMAGAKYVVENSRPVFCAIRPPGHHASQTLSQGFCLFNNIAIAAHTLINVHKLDRILIVDWDVHHGNGTQDIFYGDDRVMFFSIHRYPFYPGSGSAEETGTGRGLGYTLNEPIGSRCSAQLVKDRFRLGLEQAASKIKPQAILLSAGFDGHRQDPLGSLQLTEDDFQEMTRDVVAVANTYCPGKILSCLEGGYHLDALAASVRSHIQALEQTD